MATVWFGEAWDLLCTEKYDYLREAAFERTGCSMDLQGFGADYVSVLGTEKPFLLPDMPDGWKDEEYAKMAWSEHPKFERVLPNPKPKAKAKVSPAAPIDDAAVPAPVSPMDCQVFVSLICRLQISSVGHVMWGTHG